MTAQPKSTVDALASSSFGIAASAVAGFLVAAALIVGAIYWQTSELLTRQILSALEAEAAELDRQAADRGLASLALTVGDRAVPGGQSLYYLEDGGGRRLAGNLVQLPPELAQTRRGVFRYPGAGGVRRLAVALDVPVAGGRLLLGRDVEETRRYADQVKRIFLVGFGVLAVAGLAGGFWFSRAVMRRIDSITATSRSIMAGDLGRRIALSGSADELDALSESLNAMLDRIEQLMNGLREVSDNIAHDLKTPLNRLRNRAEAALRDPRGSEAYRQGLERTIEEADDLIKTFNSLLLIARLEAGALEETAAELDVGELVRDVAELYEPVAEEAGLALAITVEPGNRVSGNRQLIGQAIANLIDNAIKYAAQGAPPGEGVPREPIAVDVRRIDGRAAVSVADRGPGIGAGDRERVLRRFVRLEESRTKPGTGLGLSLVSAVARLHGGSIRLEDNAPGLRAVLMLPCLAH